MADSDMTEVCREWPGRWLDEAVPVASRTVSGSRVATVLGPASVPRPGAAPDRVEEFVLTCCGVRATVLVALRVL